MNMNKTIRLPMRSRKPAKSMDPFFDVEIQKYTREDGTDDGLRAIVNKVTNKTMGEVSQGYNLVTHLQASNLVKDFLNKTNVPFESTSALVGTAGAKYYETIAFPQFVFAPDGTTTALDMSHPDPHNRIIGEKMIPYIVVKNSYDKTSRISWSYGIARLLCDNGMSIVSREDTLMSYRHNQEINFDRVKDILLERLEKNIDIVSIAYKRLNEEGGVEYLRELIDGDYPDKFKISVLEKVAPFAKIESETIEDEQGKRKTLKIKSIDTNESGWAIYNVATDVASHTLTSPVDQDKVGRRIARQFQIG